MISNVETISAVGRRVALAVPSLSVKEMVKYSLVRKELMQRAFGQVRGVDGTSSEIADKRGGSDVTEELGAPGLSLKLRSLCGVSPRITVRGLRFAESHPRPASSHPLHLPGEKYIDRAMRPHGSLFFGRAMKAASALG